MVVGSMVCSLLLYSAGAWSRAQRPRGLLVQTVSKHRGKRRAPLISCSSKASQLPKSSRPQQLDPTHTMAQQQQHPATTLGSLPHDCLVLCLKHLTLEER